MHQEPSLARQKQTAERERRQLSDAGLSHAENSLLKPEPTATLAELEESIADVAVLGYN